MTAPDPRAIAIEGLGYPPRQAAFLACVARHGGYFIRRQYLDWMGCTKGRAVVEFTRRLLVRRHATRHTFCRTTHVYHLASQALYTGAPGTTWGDRRRRPVLAIKGRLMGLDLALLRPDLQFLASEPERVAYCDRLGLDRARLPQQALQHYRSAAPIIRYFPDPLLFGLLEADGTAPTVVCGYVDDGARSLSGFATFLRHHAQLLAALPRRQVLYVGERPQQARLAAAVFERAFGVAPEVAPGLAREDIGAFFRLRRLYERQAWAELRTEGLNRYLSWRARVGRDLDPLYVAWTLDGDAALARAGEPGANHPGPAAFEAVILPHPYLVTEGLDAHTDAS